MSTGGGLARLVARAAWRTCAGIGAWLSFGETLSVPPYLAQRIHRNVIECRKRTGRREIGRWPGCGLTQDRAPL